MPRAPINHGRRTAMKNNPTATKITGVRFEYEPRIENRKDALKLLDILIDAAFVENIFYPLEALKDAINREII